MKTERIDFGVLESGERASLYRLKSGPLTMTLSDYGATIVSLFLPPARGAGEDILLGSSTLAGLAGRHPYFGATVGRHAGRIGGAAFAIDGVEYPLAANDGPNHLHGGLRGFERYLWKAEAFEEGGEPRVRMTRTSSDGEEGYPGNLEVSVVFGLGGNGELILRYSAATDAPTVVNLTNHAYFNLKGAGRGSILDHEISIAASTYLEADARLLPTGRKLEVGGGAYDLKAKRRMGEGVALLGGYDCCYVLDRSSSELIECAVVSEPATGRTMRVSTTCPGVQFYTGNFLAGEAGKHGTRYDRHAGFCLEAQYLPDAVHHDDFPSVILRPGRNWEEETRYRFEV